MCLYNTLYSAYFILSQCHYSSKNIQKSLGHALQKKPYLVLQSFPQFIVKCFLKLLYFTIHLGITFKFSHCWEKRFVVQQWIGKRDDHQYCSSAPLAHSHTEKYNLSLFFELFFPHLASLKKDVCAARKFGVTHSTIEFAKLKPIYFDFK